MHGFLRHFLRRGRVAVLLSMAAIGSGQVLADSKKNEIEEALYYRYKDSSGTVVIKSSITPDEAKNGYSIITLSGRIVEEVEAEQTAEEYRRRAEEKRLEREAEEAKRLAEERDISLMLRYSTKNDLEAESKRRMSEFDIRISILRGNMLALKDRLEREQHRAANIERAGREVPDSLRTAIVELQQEVLDAEADIAQMQKEKKASADSFASDLERFNYLISIGRVKAQ